MPVQRCAMQGITLTALWRGAEDCLGSVPQVQVLVAADGLDPSTYLPVGQYLVATLHRVRLVKFPSKCFIYPHFELTKQLPWKSRRHHSSRWQQSHVRTSSVVILAF
jgi:hypothetical protein